jgi:hypothetical protein
VIAEVVTVIAGKDDNRGLRQAESIQRVKYSADLRVRRFALEHCVGGVVLWLCMLLIAWGLRGTEPSDVVIGLITGGAIFGLPGLWCLYRMRKDSCDAIVFRGAYGDLVLLHDRPDPATFAAFSQELQRRIRSATTAGAPMGASSIGRELEMLADLRARGILDVREFQDAKRRVLALLDGSEPIGFAARAAPGVPADAPAE